MAWITLPIKPIGRPFLYRAYQSPFLVSLGHNVTVTRATDCIALGIEPNKQTFRTHNDLR
ncbi:hypothetical protein [Vibrio furnissii]|uniref:hypothetical protein n=1 Tax=Vibrio furnissii TaxID=29494 RepID=UPI002572BE8C|nr:hypothetical protein [Vibrio furnissii]WJG23651.1 hypothetical protein QSU95_21840 [Vibrio furnissii]